MRKMTDRKFVALLSLLNSYYVYKGGFNSPLEIKLHDIKDLIGEEKFADLTKAVEAYKKSIVNVIANSRKVFVNLDEIDVNQFDFKEIENMFLPED